MKESKFTIPTFTLPEELMRQIERIAARDGSDLSEAVTNLFRIGLASSFPSESTVDESKLNRSQELIRKLLSGEWGMELGGFEEARVYRSIPDL